VLFDIFYRLAAQFKTAQDLLGWISRNADDRDYQPNIEDGLEVAPGLVTLSTIHQAKGKEWDHVAVLGPPDGMPDYRAQFPKSREEERRIAYVAFTRARKSVLFGGSSQFAEELERREDGLSWDDYRAGRSEPSEPRPSWDPSLGRQQPVSPRRSAQRTSDKFGDLPEGVVMKKGIGVLRSGAPVAEGEMPCTCGARVWTDGGGIPYTCPECGSFTLRVGSG